MPDFETLVIATILSGGFFSFIFYILNNNICGIFNHIREDFSKLSKSTIFLLRFASFILAILIAVYFKIRFDVSTATFGITLGFFNALFNTCFEKNVAEKII